MIEDTPQPATSTTTPPVGGETAPKKKIKKDAPVLRCDKRVTVTIQELCAELGVNCTVARTTREDLEFAYSRTCRALFQPFSELAF
jgi:hypothetical protein